MLKAARGVPGLLHIPADIAMEKYLHKINMIPHSDIKIEKDQKSYDECKK